MKQLEILHLAMLGLMREVERLQAQNSAAAAEVIDKLEEKMVEISRLVYMEKQRK